MNGTRQLHVLWKLAQDAFPTVQAVHHNVETPLGKPICHQPEHLAEKLWSRAMVGFYGFLLRAGLCLGLFGFADATLSTFLLLPLGEPLTISVEPGTNWQCKDLGRCPAAIGYNDRKDHPVMPQARSSSRLHRRLSAIQQNQPSLGDDFLQRLDNAFERILSAPEMFAKVYKEIRQMKIRRFPYVISYMIESDRVVVLAVFCHL